MTDVAELRTYADCPVRIRLVDESEHVGRLRTELLSERSISVFLMQTGGEGATLYIDQIAGIWPIASTP